VGFFEEGPCKGPTLTGQCRSPFPKGERLRALPAKKMQQPALVDFSAAILTVLVCIPGDAHYSCMGSTDSIIKVGVEAVAVTREEPSVSRKGFTEQFEGWLGRIFGGSMS
jgi:hypothetical protein